LKKQEKETSQSRFDKLHFALGKDAQHTLTSGDPTDLQTAISHCDIDLLTARPSGHVRMDKRVHTSLQI
jgi:hypothetical protein